jgi:hypothetical protein
VEDLPVYDIPWQPLSQTSQQPPQQLDWDWSARPIYTQDQEQASYNVDQIRESRATSF